MATINVTQRHIEKGLIGNCAMCPIALAIKAISLPSTVVRVDGYFANFENGNESDEVRLPSVAERFINRFDSGGPAQPFSFELYIPEGF